MSKWTELYLPKPNHDSHQHLRTNGHPAGLTCYFSDLPVSNVTFFFFFGSIPVVGEQTEKSSKTLTLGINDSLFQYACLRLVSSKANPDTRLWGQVDLEGDFRKHQLGSGKWGRGREDMHQMCNFCGLEGLNPTRRQCTHDSDLPHHRSEGRWVFIH